MWGRLPACRFMGRPRPVFRLDPSLPYIKPGSVTVRVPTGKTNVVIGTYKSWGRMRALGANAFVVNGSSGAIYRVEWSPRLGPGAVWTPLRTQMVGSASLTITNTLPSTSNAFIRAVLVP